MSKSEDNNPLITRDWLAVERTRMANERTFLAYLRSGLVFLASGVTVLEVEQLQDLRGLGVFLVVLAPLMLGIGVFRLWWVNRVKKKYYKNP